jgi:hypothetical protein
MLAINRCRIFVFRFAIQKYTDSFLPVVSYGCEAQSFILREERRLRVFENGGLGKVLGPQRDEVTGEWRRLNNGQLNDLYPSPNIIWVMKLRRIKCVGHVAWMGDSRGAFRVLVRRSDGRRTVGRPRYR